MRTTGEYLRLSEGSAQSRSVEQPALAYQN